MDGITREYGLLTFAYLTTGLSIAILGFPIRWYVIRRRVRRPAVRAFSEATALYLTLAVATIVLQAGHGSGIDFNPFAGLDQNAGRLQAILNVTMMLPVGLMASHAGYGRRHRRAWACTTVPLSIELAQLIPILHRVASLQDILLGTVGMTIGTLTGNAVLRLSPRFRPPETPRQPTDGVDLAGQAWRPGGRRSSGLQAPRIMTRCCFCAGKPTSTP